MVDVLLVSVLVLDVHGVQAQVDLDVLLEVVGGAVGVLSLAFDFLIFNQCIC